MSDASSSDSVRPVALTIAGSDSGGGAGIQADLRVFHRLRTFGTSAIAAVTAQNLAGVAEVTGIDADRVRAQIETVLSGFEVRAVKTGMLWSAANVVAIADTLGATGLPLVVDPVMIATTGVRLTDADAAVEYQDRLLRRASVMTPNLAEAAALLGRSSIDHRSMTAAARGLFERFEVPVLLKGGHLHGDPCDVLYSADGVIAWRHARIGGVNTHGSGCILSAAITALLAHGANLARACEHAVAFVHDALRQRLRLDRAALADVERAIVDVSALERIE